ncbi:protein [Lentinula edodes]|uniref:Protein n=1 Tax=Lentinula edodes TaxID=5353 RepID=A0A1Q3EQ89_LENED|nr:protein [Lentinula edodes]
MGTTQSYLSPEALVTAAVVAVGGGGGKKGKGKKKPNTTSGTSTPITEGIKTPENISILPFPAVVPGQFDDGAPDSSAGSGAEGKPKAKKGKKKKAGKAADAQAKSSAAPDTAVEESVVSPAAAAALADSNSSHVTNSSTKLSTKSKKKKQQAPSQVKPSASFSKSTASLASLATDTDGEWTRVTHRADKIHTSSIAGGTSDVGQATSITTGSSSPVDTRTEEEEDGEDEEEDVLGGSSERHPLAKRLLPKPRKTGVEDMLARSDYPSYSRVMRVQPGDKPAAGFSWGDYEDVVGGDGPSGEPDADGAEADREDDGWGVVKRGGRPKNKVSTSFEQTVPTSRTATAPETMNKRQRQNAARREAEKSAKADSERERIAALARHQRELDSARMEAQYGKSGGKKTTSGGMKAVIDEKGKLDPVSQVPSYNDKDFVPPHPEKSRRYAFLLDNRFTGLELTYIFGLNSRIWGKYIVWNPTASIINRESYQRVGVDEPDPGVRTAPVISPELIRVRPTGFLSSSGLIDGEGVKYRLTEKRHQRDLRVPARCHKEK